MSKQAKVMGIAALAAVAVAAALVCVLRKGGGGEPKPQYDDPVVARMHDDAYVAKLNAQIDERKQIMKRMAAAKGAYEKAQAAGDADALAKAKAELKACADALAANQLKSQRIVSEQMNADKDANFSKLQQKKGN